MTRDLAVRYRTLFLPDSVRIALAAGELSLAEELRAGIEPVAARERHSVATVDAALAEARTDASKAVDLYADVARGWHEYGHALEHGQALLAQARCLVALERAGEAARVLEEARSVFARLGARPLLEATDSLVAA